MGTIDCEIFGVIFHRSVNPFRMELNLVLPSLSKKPIAVRPLLLYDPCLRVPTNP